MNSSPDSESLGNSHSAAIDQLLDGQSVWDKRLISLGNYVNPLLIKETRQALKSKQFSITFALLIVVTGMWTVLMLLFSVPEIYYASNGVSLLNGYLFILIVPATLIIPQSAFHSMASELGEGTFETLSLSLLSPWEIVRGKLSVSVLQLVVYLSVLMPCIVLTYLLRGVMLSDIIQAVAFISILSVILTTVAIALATSARNRGVQMILNVFFLALQLIVFFNAYYFTTALFTRFMETNEFFLDTLKMSLLIGVPLAVLMCTIASVQISGASINKATPIRRAVLSLGIAIAVVGVLWSPPNFSVRVELGLVMGCLLAIHWAIAGGLAIGEQGFVSIRARRELPNNLLSRLFLSWFIPGPGIGYVFCVLCLAGCLIVIWLGAVLPELDLTTELINFGFLLATLWMYVTSTLGVGRFIAAGMLRDMGRWRMLVTFLTLVTLHFFLTVGTALVTSLGAGYGNISYQFYCIVNPYWTLGEMIGDRKSPGMLLMRPEVVYLLLPFTAIVFVLNLVFASRGIVLQRLTTPATVMEQRRARSKRVVTSPEEVIDPLA